MSVCNKCSTEHEGNECGIYAINPDIFRFHILSRLDGLSLVSTSCVSTHFRSLCDNDTLWRDICNSTWPSTTEPRLRSIISSFPSAHRSFYHDSFPSVVTFNCLLDQIASFYPEETSELISAVDIYYQNKVFYSKVIETETGSQKFLDFKFIINLLDSVEEGSFSLPPTFKLNSKERRIAARDEIEKHLALSWIVIDRTKKRAINLAGRIPINKLRYWILDKIDEEDEDDDLPLPLNSYATVVADGCGRMVEFGVGMACVRRRQKLYVRQVCLYLRNDEGNSVSGKDGLGILSAAMDGQRKRIGLEMEKAIYDKFWSIKEKNDCTPFARVLKHYGLKYP